MNRNSYIAPLMLVLSVVLAPRTVMAQTSSVDSALLREVQVNLVNGGTHRGVLLALSATPS